MQGEAILEIMEEASKAYHDFEDAFYDFYIERTKTSKNRAKEKQKMFENKKNKMSAILNNSFLSK